MQTRRMIVALFASIAVFYLWMLVATRIWPPSHPATQPTTQTAPSDAAPTTAATTAPAAMNAEASPQTSPSASAAGNVRVVGGGDADPAKIVLGNADPGSPYPMAILIDPRGAAVASASLRGHYETVEKKLPYRILEPVAASSPTAGDAIHSFRTTKIRFDNLKLDVPLADVLWKLSADSKDQKVFTATIEREGQPLARVLKTYTLLPQAPDKRTYDLGISLAIENLSGAPVQIIVEQQGPLGFRKEDERTEDRKVLGALWSEGDKVSVTGHLRTEVIKKKKIAMGKDADESRIAWGAETNKYFTCIMAPAQRKGFQDPTLFASMEAVQLAEPDTTGSEDLTGVTFQFVTVPLAVAPGATATIDFSCYIGPKSKRGFQTVPAYERLNYYGAITESFYICAPGALVSMMMGLLDFFHGIVRNYGLAIIILVLLVRAILHPITKKSQVNMMKMQKQMSVLQPKVDAVKQKYANDRVAMNQAMMEVYRDAGVNPAGNLLTCLPLLLQIPIWGALWTALSSMIEMRHAYFDGWWIRDLAGPDAVVRFAHAYNIPLVSWMAGPIHSVNILPVLLGISQLLQTKYMPRGTPAAQSTDGRPDQFEQQRKMMMFMSVFFVLMLYNAPSGLNLYIMASNFFGILEQWRIRKHIREEEARHAATSLAPAPDKPAEPRKPGWLESKWLDLQKQAEEARRVQSPKPKKDRRG